MNLINKLERKFGRYAVKNLMYYLIILYAIGFVLEVFGNGFYTRYLSLNMELVFSGQVWRLFTFIMGPPNTSLIFIIFSLLFYYMIGNVLERVWGTFRFNLYYISGWFLHVLAALIIYIVFGASFTFNTYYLNMSMFLAFATVAGETQVLLFFIIPIKVKWIAYADMVYFALAIIGGFLSPVLPQSVLIGLYIIGIVPSPVYAVAALVSLLNFVLFYALTRNYRRVSPVELKRRNDFKHKVRVTYGSKHRCAVCGRTEEDDENLVFRYCSKCDGNFEYCNEHLYTHKHVIEVKQSH